MLRRLAYLRRFVAVLAVYFRLLLAYIQAIA